MKHHGCRSHVRDQNKLTGQEERFDLVVDSNDVILERVVRPAALPLIQSSSLKRLISQPALVCLPGDPSRWSWWREPEPAARHACRLSASKDRRFQLESQGWLINLAAPPVLVPVFFATLSSRGFVQTVLFKHLKCWTVVVLTPYFTPHVFAYIPPIRAPALAAAPRCSDCSKPRMLQGRSWSSRKKLTTATRRLFPRSSLSPTH